MKIIYTRPDGGVDVVSMASQESIAKALPSVGDMTTQEFVDWVIAKDVPAGAASVQVVEDADVPAGEPSIPYQISMVQAELALLQTGYLDDVEAIVAAQGRVAQIEWHRRQTVERSHPLVQLVKRELNWGEDHLDQLFILGGSL